MERAELEADSYKKPIEDVYYVPGYDDVTTYMRRFNKEFIWEGDGWQESCRSWAESCYIHAGISNAAEIITGPDAQRMLDEISINDCMKWPVGKCKHLVQCDEDGYVVNHGLYTRDSETQFRSFACAPHMVEAALASGKYDATHRYEDTYIFQISGPLSLTVIEKAIGQNLHDVKFLETRHVAIPGIDSDKNEICRIGMSGTLAYELRGPAEFGPQVYDLVYQAGKPLGMKRLGWRSYTVNHTFGGYPQMTCSFEFSLIKSEEFRRISRSPVNISGSIDPEFLEARFRTPAELDWAWMAKKNDAPYTGKAAVEAEIANPKRKIVSLVWNVDDVAEIYRSQFEAGEPYKYMEMPSAVQAPAGGHADWVLDLSGNRIGYASVPVYSSYYKVFLCQAVVDVDKIQEGAELIVQWGDFGKRIKNVRATIAKYPYNQLVENQKYDMSTVPVGYK